MKISHFQLKGQRPYQEDYFYIENQERFFIVCDGMGGSTHGDLASQTITESVTRQITKEDKPFQSSGDIEELLDTAWKDLMSVFDEKPEARGMGTTFVGAFFDEDRCLIAHVGDSRAYHIRPGDSILWNTIDHSVVQQLFDKGLFSSKKEMEEDPRNPQITRAFIASEERSAPEPDIHMLNDLEMGDIIMLCSDGLVQAFKGDSHEMILADEDKSLSDKCNELEETCQERSTDNTTVILIEL